MSTVSVALVALVTFAGALLAYPVPVELVVAAGLVCLVVRRKWSVIVVFGVFASSLSASQWQALDRELPVRVDGTASVVRDPEMINGAVRAEVSIDDRRYQVWARGDEATRLGRTAVGMRTEISGAVGPLDGLAEPSLRRRHVAGRIEVSELGTIDEGNFVSASVNRLRDTIAAGATSMSDDQLGLYLGLVMGDDRQQPPQQQEDFRRSGLSHLLAVSGQNVAFLLLLLTPLTRRLPIGGRVLVGVVAIVVFGFVTRWEPSVVRAVVMATVVLLAAYLGRPSSVWRTLSLAVTACLLADPFLAGSIGFLLSIGACLGIAAFARPLMARLWGPATLRAALAVTISAQVGVAPVQLAVFGPMPGVAAVTNVVAGPCAALVMMWGMTGGIVAGLAGFPADVLLHWPTEGVIDVLAWTARTGAGSPVGNWDLAAGVFVTAAVLFAPVRHSDRFP